MINKNTLIRPKEKFITDCSLTGELGSSQVKFCEAQQNTVDNTEEIKSIATKFALNEMRLNKWETPSSRNQANQYASDWETVYQTVWLEKLMQVKVAYNVSEILDISRELLIGQKKMITALGVIVSNTGQILENQVIIITNQGLILDITQEILTNTEEIIATTNNILGRVEDIQMNVNDIVANGVTIASNDYNGGGGSGSKTIWYVIGVLGALLIIFVLLKIKKKK